MIGWRIASKAVLRMVLARSETNLQPLHSPNREAGQAVTMADRSPLKE